MKKKQYTVRVSQTWKFSGYVECEAESKEEAELRASELCKCTWENGEFDSEETEIEDADEDEDEDESE